MHTLKLLNSSLVTTYRNLCCRSSTRKTYSIDIIEKMLKKQGVSQKSSGKPSEVNQVCIDVLGSGAVGAPASVLLSTNIGPYVINCGEGMIKLAGEYKVKLHRSQNVFITHPSWKNISGLFGMALAIRDSKVPELFIHGDTDIESLFCGVHKLINLRSLKVSVRKCSHYGVYKDGVVNVKYVFLYPSSATPCGTPNEGVSLSSEQSYSTETSNLCKKSERDRSVSIKPGETRESQTEKTCNSSNQEEVKRKCMDYAISYIFKTEGSLGTLCALKCFEFGVKPGPLLGQLKNGMDVTLEDGRVVRSVDVKTPDLPGVTVIIVECPTEEYLDSLLEEPAYCEFQSEETPAEAVVHFSSASIVKSPKYQEWINRFSKKTFHLFINDENRCGSSVAIHRQQYKLNLLHPEIFPQLHDPQIPDFPRTETTGIPPGHALIEMNKNNSFPAYLDQIHIKCESDNFIKGETMCRLFLKPKMPFDYVRSLVLKKELFYNEMFENEEIKQKIEEGQQKLKDAEHTIKLESRTYPKIVFLGTGSSQPSKVRNASGILIFVNSTKSILLDCGEYTFGQLVNFYGLSKTRKILRSLQTIYVSHLHADHHMGLITILKERKLAFDELSELPPDEQSVESAAPSQQGTRSFTPVFLLAPVQILRWLTLYSEKLEDISKLFDLIPNDHLMFNNKKLNHKIHLCKESMGMTSIATASVVHCNNSFGISMIHKKGWKITYSGDTRPCTALIEMGMNSDILIHEATLEDVFAYEAKVKLHSTTSQAIEVGKRMKAKYILLTHFSQRYCHLPQIDSSFSNLNVGIAFDFMEVPFNMLPLLPMLIKPLQYAFSKYDEINKTIMESLLLKRGLKASQNQRDLKDLFDVKGTPAKVSKLS